MIANIINTLSQVISRAASDSNPSVRSRRNNRRYPIGRGLEGLEMRIAPTDIAPIMVTVTNQTTVSSPTSTDSTSTSTQPIATATPTTTVVMA